MPARVLFRRLRLLALLLLYAGMAGLVLGTVLAELGDRWWIADLFAHFRYHYALGAALLAILALAIGRRGVGMAALSLILPQIWAVAAPPRTPPAERVAAEATLRVMSVNVLYSNARLGAVARAIEREAPDIVSLQEITPRWFPIVERLAARLPNIAPVDWQSGEADTILMTRLPMSGGRIVVPPNQHRPFGHVEAIVYLGGRAIRVLGVHPPLPSNRRNTATRQSNFDYYARVAARTDLPVLIVGDLNITPYSPRFRTLLRDGGLSYVQLGWGWPRSWPSASRGDYARHLRGFPIDHILTSRHFALAGAYSGSDVGSDHYPVIADLVLRR